MKSLSIWDVLRRSVWGELLCRVCLGYILYSRSGLSTVSKVTKFLSWGDGDLLVAFDCCNWVSSRWCWLLSTSTYSSRSSVFWAYFFSLSLASSNIRQTSLVFFSISFFWYSSLQSVIYFFKSSFRTLRCLIVSCLKTSSRLYFATNSALSRWNLFLIRSRSTERILYSELSIHSVCYFIFSIAAFFVRSNTKLIICEPISKFAFIRAFLGDLCSLLRGVLV